MITRSIFRAAGWVLVLLVALIEGGAVGSAQNLQGWEAAKTVPAVIREYGSPAPAKSTTTDAVSPSGPSLYGGPSATAVTPELVVLANGLDNDPVKIFNYVRNKIEYQPYQGSHKGAHVTYLDKAGNSMDQASLLIALLNQAGYSATSYVYGTYTVPDRSADGKNLCNWLGLDSSLLGINPNLPGNVILNSKIPVQSAVYSADHTYILWTFDHVWVRATINGVSYDLDPSYKQHQAFSGIDYKTGSGYSRSQLLTDAAGTSTADYAQNLSRTAVENRLGQYAVNLRSYIQANAPNAEIEQVISGQRILEQPVSSLAQGAPLAAFQPVVTNTFSTIPSNYAATLRVQIGTQIDVTFNADSLQGIRLSLVFAASQAQLWLGDTQVTQENNGSGISASATLSVTHPNDANVKLVTASYLRTGSYDLTYSFYGNPASSGLIDASQRRLQNYLAQGLADGSREVLTETLHSYGLQWCRRVDLINSTLARMQPAFTAVRHIVGRTGQEAGYYVDMPGVYVLCLDTTSTAAATNLKVFNTAAFLTSAMEHGVLEQNGSTGAASTVKCLAIANDGGQKIFKANSSNYTAGSNIRGQLTNYSSYPDDYISAGYTVLLHQDGQVTNTSLPHPRWQGYGFAAINASTGQASMTIGGGYAGGYQFQQGMASGAALTLVNTTVATPLLNPPNIIPTVSAEPVNLLTGAYTMEHSDLALGEQNSPRGLNFSRYYDGSRNFISTALGNGWRHSCEGKVTLGSNLDMAFGLTQPTDAAQTIVGLLAASDFADISYSAKELTIGALAANWTVNRITNNAANVQLGNQNFACVSQPDGSWNPPAGSTTALRGTSGGFTLQPRFGGSVTFDALNRVSQWKDVDNNTQSYIYSTGTNSHLSSVTDSHNRTLTFSYYSSGTPNGLLQSVSDSTGRSVSFNYTAGTYSGANLTGITDPETYNTTLVYDSRNRLKDWEDNSLAVITHNDYDTLDRVYQQLSQGLSNHTWQFHYSPGVTFEIDPQGGETAHLFDYKNRNAGTVDALGHASSTSYDGQNHVTQTVDATGRKTTYLFDANQNLFKSTDNNQKDTFYTYDAGLHLWKVTDPTGRYIEYQYYPNHHQQYSYDPGRRLTQYFYRTDGLLDHIIDPANYTTSFTAYDSYGNPTNVTRADGTTTSASYNARGDRLSYIDGRVKTTSYGYDKRRLLVSGTDARGRGTAWMYDSNGYPFSVTDRNLHQTTTPHDNLGHLQSVQAPDTLPVSYGYDTRDWLTSVTDGLNHATSVGYDTAGRRTTVTNALLITTGSTAYDNAGRVSVQYDGLLHATQFFYNPVGRLDHTLDPLLHETDHTYDDAGRPWTLENKRRLTFQFGYATDGLPNLFSYPSGRQSQILNREAHGLPMTLQSPAGHQTALTYDAMSRVKTKADGVGTVTWTYDSEGNATDVSEVLVTSGSANIHRVYDELGRVSSCTDARGYVVGYGYDNEGNVSSITYPGNKTVNYIYDGSNRLKTVTDWASRVTTYYYDTAGRLDHVDRPNSTRQRVTFDNANRLTGSYEEKMSGGAVVSTLWQAGYGFDNANRLTSYTPTPMGKTYAPPATAMGYDADNQLATYNGQSVNHDLDGNLLSAPVQGTLLGALTWDTRNRLASAGGVTYSYDAENRRKTSTVNNQTAQYVWSRGAGLDRLLVKVNPDGSVTRYIYGTGLLYEETTSATNVVSPPIYYHYDWRGDTVALSDASGNVTARMSYSPYGERTIESGTVTTPFCFNGKWGVMTEPSGLLSMQARYYSPVLRRFLNEDPSGFAGGANMYAFASGDPVDFMDPFGLGQVNASSIGGGLSSFYSGGIQMSAATSAQLSPGYAAATAQYQYNQMTPGQRQVHDTVMAAGELALQVVTAIASEGILEDVAPLVGEGATGEFYSVAFETRLGSASYPGLSRAAHFLEANGALLNAMEADAGLASRMQQLGINLKRTSTGLAPRQSPAGWTWHHAEEDGVMQLVPRSQHAPGSIFQDTLHPGGQGGYSIWGQ